ncbi:MAG: cytochrome c [Proteobacteria bacterium]|nr:MAG: cytochrome c [Pseudomonadota bacterium]
MLKPVIYRQSTTDAFDVSLSFFFGLGDYMRKLLLTASCLATLTACDWNSKEDYHPKAEFEHFVEKQEADAKAQEEAVAKGDAPAVVEAPGKKTFETYCVACHGVDGKADGPAATAMNPRPRNFTDKTWQGKVDDAHIHKVIKEGGASVGLSPTMAPWGSAINDAEIDNVVKYVRHFGG